MPLCACAQAEEAARDRGSPFVFVSADARGSVALWREEYPVPLRVLHCGLGSDSAGGYSLRVRFSAKSAAVRRWGPNSRGSAR